MSRELQLEIAGTGFELLDFDVRSLEVFGARNERVSKRVDAFIA